LETLADSVVVSSHAAVEEQIYRIVDTATSKTLMTGRTNNPKRRAKEYARYDWWQPTFELVPYRVIARNGYNDEEYGMYAAAVEHMEICRNQTWFNQGGRNKMSPICQMTWGPDARAEVCKIGGIIGGHKNVESGQWARMLELPQSKAARIANGHKAVESGQFDRLRELPQTKAVQAACGRIYGHLNGPISGRKAVESGRLASYRTPEHQAKAARASGRKAVESGRIQALGRKMVESGQLAHIRELPQTRAALAVARRDLVDSGHFARISKLPQTKAARVANGRKAVESGRWARIKELPQTKAAQAANGRTQGRKNVESGQLASVAAQGGRIGGRISGRKSVESGRLASYRTPEHQANASRKGTHIWLHVNRNRPNPRCQFCSEQSLVIAFA
jgi:hypothetical protein